MNSQHTLDIKADLHCHSYYSDGTLSPTDVLELAASNDVELLALTDHDSTQGLTEAQQNADKLDIQLIAGVEISVTWQDKNNVNHVVHIVGLNIDASNQALQDGLAQNCIARSARSAQIIEALLSIQVDIKAAVDKQIPVGGLMTRTHIARALISEGYVKNMDKAFKKYLGKGKRAYVGGHWASLEQAVSWISQAGGVAVIAHPMRYRMSAMRLDSLVQEFKAAGGQGLEVITATQDVNQTARCVQLTKQYDLYASTGSDFHSPQQSWAMLGRCPALPTDVTPIWQAF